MQLSAKLISNLYIALFLFSISFAIFFGYSVRSYFIENKNTIKNSTIVEDNGKYTITNNFNTNSYVVDIKHNYYVKRSILMQYHKDYNFPMYWTDTGIDKPGQTLYLNNKESVDSLNQMLNVIISTE